RVDHAHAHVTELVIAIVIQRNVRRIDGVVLRDLACAGSDRRRDLLGCGPAVGEIVLDAEVAVRSAGIVARGQDDAAVRLTLADHTRRRRCRQYSAATNEYAAHPVRRRDAEDDLNRLAVEVAAVAAYD